MPSERYAQLKHLRAWRVRPERDVSIGAAVGAAAAAVEEQRRAGRGAGAVWEELAPARVRERCRVVLVQRGVMTVRVRDAAARFEIDRWLRAGGESALIRRAGIRRVKIVL